jgi:trans-2,3-dihydro-3-hydroxyanthranilate isomerase
MVEPGGPDDGRARFELPQLPEPLPLTADEAAMAAALNLSPADIGFDDFRPARWTAGNVFTFVPLKGLDAVARCRPDLARFDATFGGGAAAMVFVYCRETSAPGIDFHARMFAPGVGIFEDPVTGSAAAAFTGLVAARNDLPDGDHTLRTEQGLEMGRPGLVEMTLAIRDRKLATASVGGGAIVVTEGMIEA